MKKYNKPCVFGCNTTGKVVHRFPNFKKFPDKFNAWVQIAGSSVANLSHEYICQNKKVCDIHFKLEDHNRNSRLNALAVPSLHLPSHISDGIVPIIETPSPAGVLPRNLNTTETENVSIIELTSAESVTKCRFCMMEIIEAKHIFEDYIDGHVPIYLAMKICLYPIEVSITDHLSTYVCVQCFNTLSTFMQFRAMILRNDKILRKQIDKNIPSVSKKTPGRKQNIDDQNEPHLMKKNKMEQVPKHNYYHNISKRPKIMNQGEGKRNNSTENVIHSEQVAKSTFPQCTLISSSAEFIKASFPNIANQEQGGGDVPNTIIWKENVKQSDPVSPGQHVVMSEIQIDISKSSFAKPISINGTYEPTNNSNEKVSTDQQPGNFIVQLDISKSFDTPISPSTAFVEPVLSKTYYNEPEEETLSIILEENIKQSDSDISHDRMVLQSEIQINDNELSSVPISVTRTYGARKRPKFTNRVEEKLNHSKENLSPDHQVAKSKIQVDINESTPKSRSIAFVEAWLQKTYNNEEPEGGTMPRALILEEVDVSDGSQSIYDNVAFCLADGFLMEHKILKGNLRYLKCALAECPAVGIQKVLITGLFENIISMTKRHNHEKPTQMDVRKQKFISVIRKRLQIAKGLSIKSIYNEVCKLHPDLAQLVPMEDLKKAICNL